MVCWDIQLREIFPPLGLAADQLEWICEIHMRENLCPLGLAVDRSKRSLGIFRGEKISTSPGLAADQLELSCETYREEKIFTP